VRAHGDVRQDQLDSLRAGLTVDGIHYGPIEATLDRSQGANVWLTFSIREGKNREVRNVLGAIGLQVNRLIRVSFGPFQLADLPDGAVEEVKTRILREQLGDRVTALAGCDFSGPIVERVAPEQPSRSDRDRPRTPRDDGKENHDDGRPARGRTGDRHSASPAYPDRGRDAERKQRPERRGERADHRTDDRREFGQRTRNFEAAPERTPPNPGKHRSGNAWRDQPASGKRKFHGSRREEPRAPEDDKPGKRAGLLKDRRGRRILVERIGMPKLPEPEPPPKPKRRAPRRDRAGGPRPSRPKGR